MIFLFPYLKELFGKFVDIGQVTTGISGTVGVGASLKGVYKYRNARKKKKFALMKYQNASSYVTGLLRRSKNAVSQFNSYKKSVNNGILQKTLIALSSYKRLSQLVLPPDDINSIFTENILDEYMQAFGTVVYDDTEIVKKLSEILFSEDLLTTGCNILAMGEDEFSKATSFLDNVEIKISQVNEASKICSYIEENIQEYMPIIDFLAGVLDYIVCKLEAIGITTDNVDTPIIQKHISEALLIYRIIKQLLDSDLCIKNNDLLITGKNLCKKYREDLFYENITQWKNKDVQV